MEDPKSRGNALELARRTRKNLDFIRKARRKRENVLEVTQLVISLLALIVHPWERHSAGKFWNVKMSALVKQDWPEWEIAYGHRRCRNLGDMTRRVRNAMSHGYISFSSDSPCLSQVSMVMRDRKPPNPEFFWEARISGEGLYLFCIRFTQYVEDQIG